MEINTELIINLHKIDKRLDAIHESKGELPSLITKEEGLLTYISKTLHIDYRINLISLSMLDKNSKMSRSYTLS